MMEPNVSSVLSVDQCPILCNSLIKNALMYSENCQSDHLHTVTSMTLYPLLRV